MFSKIKDVFAVAPVLFLVVGGAAASLVVGIVWIFVWFFTPEMVNVQVKDTNWIYTSELRVRETMHSGEWGEPGRKGHYNEPAFNVSCRNKYYGTEDCYPYNCNCSKDSKGNETCDTCYHQCDVYRDWCDYSYFDWPVAKTESTSGTGHETSWPVLTAKSATERLERSEFYQVTFNRLEDVYEHEPRNLTEYRKFSVGDYWRLQVGKLRTHHIEELIKLTAEKE
jgi:hypothetical protein